MYPAGNLFIPAPHGRLEAILKEPSARVRGVSLVLHPHPLHGGTMHNKVVFRVAAALNAAGLVTLRINFRGVGQSTGTYDEGRGERDEFGDVARLRELAAKVGEHAPAQLAVVAGADHFFHQHLDELKKVITEWIERQLSSEEDVARGLLPVQPLPSGEGI